MEYAEGDWLAPLFAALRLDSPVSCVCVDFMIFDDVAVLRWARKLSKSEKIGIF